MAKEDKDNKKCPHCGPYDKDGQFLEGTFYGHEVSEYCTTATGCLTWDHSAPTGKGKDNNHNTTVYEHGGTRSHQKSGKKDRQISSYMYPKYSRFFTGAGSSQHTKEHDECFSGNCHNRNVGGQKYAQGKSDFSHGNAKKSARLSQDHAVISPGSTYAGTTENTMSYRNTPARQGNHTEKDSGTYTHGDCKYGVCKDDAGQYGMKNMDYAAKEKFQVQSLKSDMMVTAQEKDVKIEAKKSEVSIKGKTKITLEVGGSSIVIENGKITLKAGEIILDGTCHLGGQGGQLCGKCGGGCASKVFVN